MLLCSSPLPAAEHPAWTDIKQSVLETGRAPCDLHVYAHRVQIIVPRSFVPTPMKGPAQ